MARITRLGIRGLTHCQVDRDVFEVVARMPPTARTLNDASPASPSIRSMIRVESC
jgi:hypothetical protein